MKLTNKLNLPDAIVRAVSNDKYSKGNADISATQLISPPQIRILRQEHEDEIEEDVSDRIWMLFGTATHAIVEAAASKNELQEMRLFANCDGMRISGALDMYDPDNGIIYDIKTCSVWKIVHADFIDWAKQMMVYTWLARHNSGKADASVIIALMRDWTESKAGQDGYPECQVKPIHFDKFSDEIVESYVKERVALHKRAAAGEHIPCTDEERWLKPTTYAVMKEGRKSAVRVLENRADADSLVADLGAKHSVQERPGQAVRCERYCNVSKWCEQYQKEIAK